MVEVGVVDAAVLLRVVAGGVGAGGGERVVCAVEGCEDFAFAPLGVYDGGEELFFVEGFDLRGGGEEGGVGEGAAGEVVAGGC